MENNVTARSTDPETSHEAAESITKVKQQQSVKTVVAILEKYGELTDFQIEGQWHLFYPKAKWSESLPRKARGWAREAGLVRHAGFGDHNGHRVRKWGLGKEENLPANRAAKPAVASEAEAGLLLRCKQLEKELEQSKVYLATANEEIDTIHACADETEKQLKASRLESQSRLVGITKLTARVEEKQLQWEEAGRCLCETINQRDALSNEVLRLQTLIPSSKARRWFLAINTANGTLVGISLDRATAESTILPMAAGRIIEMVEVQ